MSEGVALWDRFVAAGLRDARALDQGVAALVPMQLDLVRDRTDALGQLAFRIGMASLLVGAEDVGRLALAIERTLDLLASHDIDPGVGLPVLTSSTFTLRQSLEQLAAPDRSGARVLGLPLAGARFELETMFPIPGTGRRPTIDRGPAADTPDVPVGSLVRRPAPPADAVAPVVLTTIAPAPGFTWVPTVDDDMIELFFDECTERLEALAGKLLEIERRPNDAELLRDVFRDLHTVKGSSAMVGMQPVNQLAHAAEDLVGSLRDGARPADAAAIDALLATLDALRDMLRQARAREPITLDPSAVVRRLRDPANPANRAPVAPAPAEVHAAEPAHADGGPRAAEAARQTIRVDFDKLDRLLNLVGELVLGRDGLRGAMGALTAVSTELSTERTTARRVATARAGAAQSLSHLNDELGRVERVLVDISQDLDQSTGRLDSISSELRDQVMRLRMVPIGGVFRKHVRTVRDLATSLGKRARLELVGEDTELDKLLVEALDEPLLHLVRNSVDHGVEPPEARLAAGKPAEGVVKLSAAHRGNQVVVRISDDGRGMDPAKLKAKARSQGLCTDAELAAMDDRDALELIFRPGFSTAAQVTDVSGRGVGMDVVRQTIVTRLKGVIDLDSTLGQGSTFTLRLPLTLAIIQVLLARAGGEVFAIPLDAVVRTAVVPASEVTLVGDRELILVRGRHVALIRLDQVLELDGGDGADGRDDQLHVILTEQGGEVFGLACDHLLGKKEIVIKSLGELLAGVPCASGATLLGDRCALILDVPAVIARALRQPTRVPRALATPASASSGQVLIVEDSNIVRESLRRIVAEAGFDVTVAVDGQAGLELCQARQFDLVSTDVMMPRMDGYELTRALRAMPSYADTPIVMVTSRGERIDRVRGFDAGVDEYITKPHDRQLLLRAIKKLLGRGEA
ncbi:MAG: response regulator [Deltaproteobacteria bacterium]|nr:response regulator [Deltaproteobacteria bacterium]